VTVDVGSPFPDFELAPAGPTIERYGSADPWPWDRFDY
jgi:hypothetical protein